MAQNTPAGGNGSAEGSVSTSALLSARPLGVWGMRLQALEDAPCQSVVLSEDDGIDARCRYRLAGHPKKVGEPSIPMHEDTAGTCRWWIDGAGDIHLAWKPGVRA